MFINVTFHLALARSILLVNYTPEVVQGTSTVWLVMVLANHCISSASSNPVPRQSYPGETDLVRWWVSIYSNSV